MTWQLALIGAATGLAVLIAWACRGDKEDAEAEHTYGAGVAEPVEQ